MPHLVYPSKYFLVIDGSDNISPLKEYKTMPVMKAMIEKNKRTSGRDKITVRLYIKKR